MLKRNLILAGASALASSLLAAPIARRHHRVPHRGRRVRVHRRPRQGARALRRRRGDGARLRAPRRYPRLTIEDTATARAVTSRLEKRLDYLRQAERGVGRRARGGRERRREAHGDLGPDRAAPRVAVDRRSPRVRATSRSSSSRSSPSDGNRVRTRRATIVKQGDKMLAIMKGRSHHFDVNSDIHDEDELLEAR